MKTSSIPAVRVSPALREAAEDLLDQGETLSAFVEESVRRNIELRRVQRLFLERGLESARKARESGTYVPARDVLQKLSARFEIEPPSMVTVLAIRHQREHDFI